MLAHALANIYPDKAAPVPGLIAKLVEIVNTPAIRQYDTMQWREDAMETLNGPKSHMTYLSILAWIITNYKMAGGDDRYDALLEDWDFRYELLRTAEIGGGTVKEKGMRHYRLGEFALVGEATALAMRTNIKR